jgi:hypothetical protein
MHCDLPWMRGTNWATSDVKELAKSQGVEPWTPRILNSGVLLFDRSTVGIWDPPAKEFAPTHCAEQHWIEHNIATQGVQIEELQWRFNCQWYWKDFKGRVDAAHFVHLANCPHEERLSVLAALADRKVCSRC